MVETIQGQSTTCIYTGNLTRNIRVWSCSPALVNVRDFCNVLFLTYSFAFIYFYQKYFRWKIVKHIKTILNFVDFRIKICKTSKIGLGHIETGFSKISVVFNNLDLMLKIRLYKVLQFNVNFRLTIYVCYINACLGINLSYICTCTLYWSFWGTHKPFTLLFSTK